MTRVSLGEHAKMTVLAKEREQLQKFYRDVLGCNVVTKSKAADRIQFGPNFYIGVAYDDAALSDSDGQKAIWLEIRTDDPDGLRQKILKFGINEIDYWDKKHFYFQAPGGQVFRLTGQSEGMSKITQEPTSKPDYRLPTASKWAAPRSVADGDGGTIIAVAEIAASPERVFQALTTAEVERWWGHPEYYRQTDWKADLTVCGQWSVQVVFNDGSTNGGNGEFAEIDRPRKLVMTRKFEKHPLQGSRETTITYRLEPLPDGTRLTVREEGYIGRRDAAYGNAEHWERVLGWLDSYVRRTR